MSKAKRINPYSRLLDEVKQYFTKVKNLHERMMFFYPKEKLDAGFNLSDLYERTKAAEQLGYSVMLVAADRGLEVIYKKNPPYVPYEWR